jgi:hypothetical protein
MFVRKLERGVWRAAQNQDITSSISITSFLSRNLVAPGHKYKLLFFPAAVMAQTEEKDDHGWKITSRLPYPSWPPLARQWNSHSSTSLRRSICRSTCMWPVQSRRTRPFYYPCHNALRPTGRPRDSIKVAEVELDKRKTSYSPPKSWPPRSLAHSYLISLLPILAAPCSIGYSKHVMLQRS